MVKILRDLDRKLPDSSTARVRNYLVRGPLGSESTTIHENIVGIEGFVPWHTHSTEEILVLLEGEGECHTETSVERYRPGEVVIIPAGVLHSLRSVGTVPLRQLCVFPTANVKTRWRDEEAPTGFALSTAN
jgi:quercetin dioxygenase-like cupin family protein